MNSSTQVFSKILKRVFDFTLALVLFIVLLPIFLLVALLIRVKMGSPVLFRQKRPGLNSKIFEVFKFRSMLDSFDKNGEPLSDADRLTDFGQFLRSTSLDEIPQLINVLRGDMSFVGPRPLLVEYLQIYTDQEARRHDVLPGITGWAQVNGRNALSWKEKLALDVWYVDNWNFSLDLKILVLTVTTVLSRKGVSGRGVVTSKKYDGNN